MKVAEEKAAKGKQKGKHNIMNGRALFTYNKELFKDDDGAANADDYEEEKEQAEGQKTQGKKDTAPVDESLFANEQVEDEDVDFD
mmetsp:Transcript_9986/g.16791  ORF Transcript_9986/g.16791 Transcript_9986/m.16791 type:complete len:85 (-) Transcript_9986:88-342(-)